MSKYHNPFPTTDIIIEYDDGKKNGIVLIERKNEPHGTALPGGFAEYGLSLEQNAAKEAREETGLDIEIQNPNRPWVYSSPGRDPRAHTISNTYLAIGKGTLQAGDDAKEAFVYTLYEVKKLVKEKKLVFDHGKILEDYLKHKGISLKDFKRIGFIGRFKPFHLGAAFALETLCEMAEEVIIGLGSSNKYNVRNPFTAEESQEMADAFLKKKFSNYKFVKVPDFGHIPEYSNGQKWKSVVKGLFGKLDLFVSGNDYVIELLKEEYKIERPVSFVPKEKQAPIKATLVRLEIARGEDWKRLVPKETIAYLESKGLVERFRKEFGLETLAMLAENPDYLKAETYNQEKSHAKEK